MTETTPRFDAQSGDLSGLERVLGHRFAHRELLLQALTHRSQAYELAMEAGAQSEERDGADVERSDNERLEFLGDAVLGLVVAEALFHGDRGWQEGELTRMRAQLVSRRHMAEVALSIGLGEHLRLGKGEERSGGRKKAAILANAMEAVIAAMFLDAEGGTDPDRGLLAVRQFAQEHILGEAAAKLANELRSGAALGDHKSALQEHLQAARAGAPMYLVVNESGPDHHKRFQVELRLRTPDGQLSHALASGTGTTKKKAEQEAARKALAGLLAAEPESAEPAGKGVAFR